MKCSKFMRFPCELNLSCIPGNSLGRRKKPGEERKLVRADGAWEVGPGWGANALSSTAWQGESLGLV